MSWTLINTTHSERNYLVARQIITTLLDDIDGTAADETVTFALDGNGYEIDLNAKNSKKLRDFLATFIEAGTRTGRVGAGAQLTRHRGSVQSANSSDRQENKEIRLWATENGFQINDRGRIPQSIVDAYRSRNNALNVVTAIKQGGAAKKTAGSRMVSFKPGG